MLAGSSTKVAASVALWFNGQMSEWNRRLREAVRDNDKAGVRAALAAGADAHGVDDKGETLLHLACRNAALAVAPLLLAAGADLEARNTWGWTPLCFAVTSGNPAMARWLIAAGADLHSTDQHGHTILERLLVHSNHETWDAEMAVVFYEALGWDLATPYQQQTLLEHFAEDPEATQVIRQAMAASVAAEIGAGFDTLGEGVASPRRGHGLSL